MSKTHVIDGVTYVEVDRVAKAGEKIVVKAKGNGWYDTKIGNVYEVVDGKEYGFDINELRDSESAVYVENGENSNSCMSFIIDDHYCVLEPLTSNPDLAEILANLARRVSSLECQLRDTQGNCEKLAEELARVKYISECNTEDIIDIDGRLIAVEGREQSINAEFTRQLAEGIAAYDATFRRLGGR